MRNLTAGCSSLMLLSLLLTLDATAQVPPPRVIGQVPKQRVAVSPPQLNVIRLVSRELVVVDVAGNGIDLAGDVRTSLVTGSPARMRWVKPQSDDAIVVVDATALRAAGLSLSTAAGVPLDGSVFPQGGLRVTDASGSSFTISDGLDLLARLDGNRDGRLDKSDPAWAATSLFRDRDADGTIGGGELTRAEELLQSISVAASGSESADAFGTLHVPGTGRLRDGTSIAIAHARPAAIE
jgi:hypothetical protein